MVQLQSSLFPEDQTPQSLHAKGFRAPQGPQWRLKALKALTVSWSSPSTLSCASATLLAAQFVFGKEEYIKLIWHWQLEQAWPPSGPHPGLPRPCLPATHTGADTAHLTTNNYILTTSMSIFCTFSGLSLQGEIGELEILAAQGSALLAQATGLCPEDNRDAAGFHQFTHLKQL